VEVKGTVRTHDNELRHRIFELIEEKSPAICDLYGCRFVPDMPWNGLPPLVNNVQLVEQVKRVGEQLEEVKQVVVMEEPLTLGEDFAIYLQELPGAFWVLGVRPPEEHEMPPLHNPNLAPDERAICVGVKLMVENCLLFLQS
jgi:metal-dependent amidase/aminoacylase/carboxypeptidase family protein